MTCKPSSPGLQTLDPSGVCARTVQESVLIQVRELSLETKLPPFLERMVLEHWNDLANHSYEKIARRLGASADQITAAVEFMRTHLCPYPGRLFHPPHAPQGDDSARFVRPDVIIRREVANYVVEIMQPMDFELRVSEAYHRACATARTLNATAESSAEYTQAVEQYRRACGSCAACSSASRPCSRSQSTRPSTSAPFSTPGKRTR